MYVTDPIVKEVTFSFPEGPEGPALTTVRPSPRRFLHDAEGVPQYVGPVPWRIARCIMRLWRRGWSDEGIAEFFGYAEALVCRLRQELEAEGALP